MVELKPCPFCGHNPLTYKQTGLIECCYSMCGVNPRSDSCEDWNSRVSDKLAEENAELREAIESAMRIKDLWLPFHVVANEHEGEAVPLHKMYNRFYQLLNK